MLIKLKHSIQKWTGITFYRRNTPWGQDLFNDLRRLNHTWRPNTIFDVGANVGQTAISYSQAWPDAVIHSFEPVQSTFRTLTTRLESLPNATAHRLGLSDSIGESTIHIFGDSVLASLDSQAGGHSAVHEEKVETTTVDAISNKLQIDRIELLKIDTEGHDLSVLTGAEALLASGGIDFVIAEAAAIAGPGKVSLESITNYLQPFDMICVGLYEQDFWHARQLHYFNALFCRRPIL